MDIYIEEKRLSAHHKMKVCDVDGNQLFEVSGKPFSVGGKLYVSDMNGNELLYIHQAVLSMSRKYEMEQNGTKVAEIKRKIGLHKNFDISGLDWTISGDLTGHEYSILDTNGQQVCTVSRKWLQWGDTFHLSIADENNLINCIGIVVVLNEDEDEQQGSEFADVAGAL